MAAKTMMKSCPVCGHVNPPDNVSCSDCLSDLTGRQAGGSGPSQLAHLSRLVRESQRTNRRLTQVLVSVWAIFALVVAWTVVAGVMGVGGPAALLRWPF